MTTAKITSTGRSRDESTATLVGITGLGHYAADAMQYTMDFEYELPRGAS